MSLAKRFSSFMLGIALVSAARAHPAAVRHMIEPYTVNSGLIDGQVDETLAVIVDNGIISIVTGNYPPASGNTSVAGADGKPMTHTAPMGAVVIGN